MKNIKLFENFIKEDVETWIDKKVEGLRKKHINRLIDDDKKSPEEKLHDEIFGQNNQRGVPKMKNPPSPPLNNDEEIIEYEDEKNNSENIVDYLEKNIKSTERNILDNNDRLVLMSDVIRVVKELMDDKTKSDDDYLYIDQDPNWDK